ncbi:MAG: hypothetical protein KatS3mg110_0266 [Pirellulaceae bacterium]|nr:MAG: hypothetical protein KatS3mg110_0266 [Pirellulaceae bacterium]
MKITRLHVDGFGIWTDLLLDGLSGGVTVIYGPNEAGKTTLMQFVRSVLYGFTAERRRRYLPPVHGGAGGTLCVQTLGGDYRLIRRPPPADNPGDSGPVQLLGTDGEARGDLAVGQLLGHVDEKIFSQVFAIGLIELQELATLQETEAADELYKLSSGVDRVSLVDVIRDIERRSRRWLAPDQLSGTLHQWRTERERLLIDAESAGQATRNYLEAAARQGELKRKTDLLQQQLEALDRELRRLDVAIEVQPLWQQRCRTAAEADSLQLPVDIPEEAAAAAERLDQLIRRRQSRIGQCEQSLASVRNALQQLPGNAALWQARHRLPALREWLSEYQAAEARLTSLQTEIDQLETELRDTCQELGIAPQAVRTTAGGPDQKTIDALKGPAQALRSTKSRFKQARQQYQDLRAQARMLEQKFQEALAELGIQRVDSAREQAQELLRKLQRRQELEQEWSKLQRERKNLEEECVELLKTPLMPLRHILAWGSIVAFGVMLTLIALFSEWIGDLRVPMILFGLLCTGGGFLLQHAYQQINSQELDEQQRQMARIQRQLDQIAHERRQFDESLPTSVPTEKQLREVEQRIRQLDQLSPLEEQLRAAQSLAEEARKQLAQRKAEYGAARQKWRAALAKQHLSEDLSPRDVHRLAANRERVAVILRQLEERRSQLQQKQSRMEEAAREVSATVKELELPVQDADIRANLQRLEEAVAAERQLRQKRRELLKERHRWLQRLKRATRQTERLTLRRQAIYSRFGATDSRQFAKLVEQARRRRSLQGDVAQLDQRIDAVLAGRWKPEELRDLLEATPDLAREQRKLEEERARLRKELADLQQELGRTTQTLETLAGDRRIDELRLKLATVDERVRYGHQICQRLALTAALLEQVRLKYENERQPDALREASEYLALITAGRYPRLWAPLGKRTLRVDDAQGNTFSLDSLSQGTREAIFLSLRLALAAAYARHGVRLPLILDDVLVNLDRERAAGAARAIHRLAATGIQVLVFTCHEHVVALFEAEGAEICRLPARAVPGLVLKPEAARKAAAQTASHASEWDTAAEAEEGSSHAGGSTADSTVDAIEAHGGSDDNSSRGITLSEREEGRAADVIAPSPTSQPEKQPDEDLHVVPVSGGVQVEPIEEPVPDNGGPGDQSITALTIPNADEESATDDRPPPRTRRRRGTGRAKRAGTEDLWAEQTGENGVMTGGVPVPEPAVVPAAWWLESH